MKKSILIITISLISSFTFSQELGFRLGQVTASDAAIDAIFSTGQFNRIHANLSFGGGGMAVDTLWDFLYRPFKIEDEEGFFWYVGAGPSMYINDPFLLSAMSEVGVEYRFEDVPISLGFDWRPTLVIVEQTDFVVDFFGFNARYVFN